MQTRSLRTLATIHDVGSFATAAAQLNMTLPAVSMQMKGLEKDFGFDLFDRSFRPPKLTPMGREIAVLARNMADMEDQLIKACLPGDRLRGRYRIGFVGTASIRILPRFLAATQEEVPDASFDVETGLSEDLQEKVARGHLDLALVTRADMEHAVLNFSDLAREEIVYALPAAFGETPIQACMRDIPFLHFMPNTGIGKLISKHLANLAVPPERTIVLDGVEPIVECVKAGIGFTALPKPDVTRYGGRKISTRPLRTPPLFRHISIVTRKGSATDRQLPLLRRLFLP